MKDLLSASDRVQYALYRYTEMTLQSGEVMAKSKGMWSELSGQCFTYYVGCNRILNTPYPFSYIAHLRTLLFIWLALLPWYLGPIYGWYMLILTVIIGYAIIGVEEAASEVEQPFGTDFNDLPLDEMAESGYLTLEMYMEIATAREKELDLVSAQSITEEELDEASKDLSSMYSKFRAGASTDSEIEEEHEFMTVLNVEESIASSSIDGDSKTKSGEESKECPV